MQLLHELLHAESFPFIRFGVEDNNGNLEINRREVGWKLNYLRIRRGNGLVVLDKVLVRAYIVKLLLE